MLALGHSLNIEMVAEGVETLETEQRLRQIGCHFGQGYLYSRPVPATRVPDLLAQNRRAQEPPMVVRLMAG
jgi:EAL domain-containing protein (putative c-di-GMP-specific phosphodiesterase class I)